MIRSDLVTTAQRPNERTRVLEWIQVDITDLTDEEFVTMWLSITDDKEKFIIANTLRRCCQGMTETGETSELP